MKNPILLLLPFAAATLGAATLNLPVTRDTWISSVDGETEGCNGGSARLKLKGYQEFSLLDFDVSTLKGKNIRKATLELKLCGEERLWRVSVGTIGVEWYEGQESGYAKEPGASSFRWRRNPDVPWTDDESFGYSDITSVIFGGAGSIWSSADASDPVDGWQSVNVSPAVVEARVKGVSHGFALFDDTGTELMRTGDKVNIRLFPNRFFYSKDQNAKVCPRLVVEYDEIAIPPLPKLGEAELTVVDEFVKFAPDGTTVPRLDETYLHSNVLWNAATKCVDLAGARGEFVGFQLAARNASGRWQVALEWEGEAAKPRTEFFRLAKVETPRGAMGDPALPLGADGGVTFAGGTDGVIGEIYIPKDASAGARKGHLVLKDGEGRTLTLDIALRIWNFAIPDRLSFLPEMNCYNLPPNERDYYRLAQLHRTYVNCVPYGHSGKMAAENAPRWNAAKRDFDWSAWEKRYSQYFDGSAFADLPRGAVPVEMFFLPLFENFPGNVFKGFKGVNEWPDEDTFTAEYLRDFDTGVRLFGEKIRETGWKDTTFLFFLNNKMDYKRNGWSAACSPWLLDEPASGRDFAALAFFGRRFKNALPTDMRGRNIRFRADVSRPQWERDYLDDVLDVYVVAGGVFQQYRSLVLSRCRRFGRFLYTYGTTAAPHESAFQPVLWTFDAWSLGADGIVPWQTIGEERSWRTGDELSLFYPAVEASNGRVTPSVRLKAYRRGEQDAEYLNLLLARTGRAREDVAKVVRRRLALDRASYRSLYAEDAGTKLYDVATPDDLETLRREIAEELEGQPAD